MNWDGTTNHESPRGAPQSTWHGRLPRVPRTTITGGTPVSRRLRPSFLFTISFRRLIRSILFALLFMGWLPAAEPQTLFDGKTLTGWDGDPRFWRVEDGAITGETTPESALKANTFLIWRGGTVADFTMEFSYRIVSNEGNSGFQFRSVDRGQFQVSGYQANIEQGGKNRNGMLYDEGTGREVLALAGERTRVGDGKTRLATEKFAEAKDLFASVKGQGEWNRYRVDATGNHIRITINGVLMSEVTDEGGKQAAKEGIIAFQLHVGKPMKLQLKDLILLDRKP